jgi:hypothetical protein
VVTPSTQAQAAQLHDQAQALDDTQDDEALRLYHEALRLHPERPASLYNIGLIHKYRSEWPASLQFNRRAVELDPGNEAALWNLAIAATALHDWPAARAAWAQLGISVKAGAQAIDDDFGITPVRLNPDEAGEVVWARRIDPVRARILNIPYPTSGFRCHDLVLHDGAPVGERLWQGREYPVFNVLALFEASQLSTIEAEVLVSSEADLDELRVVFDEHHLRHEDWTVSVRTQCRQCSEGCPHDHHDEGLSREWQNRHVLGIATGDIEQAHTVLKRWATGPRTLLRFEHKLSPPG